MEVLKSTSVKKTTFRTPFFGGSAILEIVFLYLYNSFFITMRRDRYQIISIYPLNMDTKNYFPKC